jgi:hypothetical protein
LLTRLGKYTKNELKDYPKEHIVNGQYDPVIWKLTREAETDEKLIEKLRKDLKISSHHGNKMTLENQDLKSQLNYASNYI